MMPDPEHQDTVPTTTFERGLSVMERMTWPRMVLWGLTGLIGIGLYYFWEDRGTLFPKLFQNPVAMWLIGVAVALGVFGTVGSTMLGNLEAKTNRMQTQIEMLREQLYTLRASESNQQLRVSALERRDEECRAELFVVNRRLNRADQILRDNNLEFKAST